MRPQTFTDVPSTRKPLSSDPGSRPEPTSRGQTYAKFKKITRTQPSRARTRQRAALSGLACSSILSPRHHMPTDPTGLTKSQFGKQIPRIIRLFGPLLLRIGKSICQNLGGEPAKHATACLYAARGSHAAREPTEPGPRGRSTSLSMLKAQELRSYCRFRN